MGDRGAVAAQEAGDSVEIHFSAKMQAVEACACGSMPGFWCGKSKTKLSRGDRDDGSGEK